MNMTSFPRLTALSGPLKGSSWELLEEISIGRDDSNRLPIADTSLSRHHCVIRKEGEQFKIVDLDSLNGTFLDGMPIKERVLSHGSQVEVGYSIFLCLLNDEPSPVSSPGKVHLDNTPPGTQSTTKLRAKDAIYLQENKDSLPQTHPSVQGPDDSNENLLRNSVDQEFGFTLCEFAWVVL